MSHEELLKLAVDITIAKLQVSTVPATKETGVGVGEFLEEVYYKLDSVNNSLFKRPN